MTIKALLMQESSNGKNPKCLTENWATALGPLQITRGCIDDVNGWRRAKGLPEYALADRLDRSTSIAICREYLAHYVGTGGTAEAYARTWYGGPKGPTRNSTLQYWHEVGEIMRTQAGDRSSN